MMRTYKSLLSSAVVLFLPALIVLISNSPIQATSSCTTLECVNGDTTVGDFVQGLFYATGLSNLGSGGVQLLPMGLTSPWTDDFHLPAARSELAAVSFGNILYAIGGNDITNFARAEIFSASTYITGAIKSPGWSTPTVLPAPLAGMAAVIAPTSSGGYLYVIGGYYRTSAPNSTTVPTSTISYRQIAADGSFVGSWQSIFNALPIRMYYSSAVVRNGNLYVIGGYDKIDSWGYVFRYPINLANGSLGAVVTETNQLNVPRFSAPANVWTDANGIDHLYVLGGQNQSGFTGATLQSVERTTFQPDNSIAAFSNNVNDQLLTTLTAHGSVQSNGRMFVTGGAAGVDWVPITQVNSSLIDPGGNLHLWGSSAWVVSTPLLRPRVFHGTTINSGGEIYVIGGYGTAADGEGNGSATVFHGSTNGFGSQYAPSGTYLSRAIDLTTPQDISEIAINSTITGTTTMTIQYRYGNDKNNLPATWINLGSLVPGQNVTTTFPVSFTASVVQYRATLTSPSPYGFTPILNAFLVKYPSNVLPDLTVVGMDTPASTVSGSTVITVYVKNQGLVPTRPINRLASPPTSSSTSSNSAVAPRPVPRVAAGNGWFWVDVYYSSQSPPVHVTDPGDCFAAPAGVNPGRVLAVPVICSVAAGSRNYWAQADTCPPGNACSVVYGSIRESDETNNIGGPFASGTHYTGPGSGGLYFPLIAR